MTQREFARFTGVSHKTVERWESSGAPISGPITTLARILDEQPQIPEYYEVPRKTYSVRIWYMFRDEVCTLIDVEERSRRVQIRNYTNRLQMRAFGVKEKPTYEDYEEFLESRCFPRSGDKMKLRLQELDIPFYEPFLIIEKTQGRMSEDDFWLRIER